MRKFLTLLQLSGPCLLLAWACTPLRDLDRAGAGEETSVGGGVASPKGGESSAGGSSVSAGTPNSGPHSGGNGSASSSGVTSSGASHNGGSPGGAGSGSAQQNPAAGGAQAGAQASLGGASSFTPQGAAGGALGGNVNFGGQADGGTRSSSNGGATASGGAIQAGASTSAGAPSGGANGGRGGTAGTLPNLQDISDSPVSGQITLSQEAEWEVDAGKMAPTFEIKTPTASYWLVKAAAGFSSIEDPNEKQWIAYSYGYRPTRGLPNLGVCCQPGDPNKLTLPSLTTVLDEESFSKTHARLVSKSSSGDIHIVWDFFLTHVTITIQKLNKIPYGFTYSGVIGTALESTDRLGLPTGVSRDANSAWSGDLPGPAEWVYFTDPDHGQSLFLIQHAEDDLPESYQVAYQDTGKFVFGAGQSTTLPIRFSMGIVGSTVHADVAKRVQFVIDNVK